ncbi:unnamed protein product [Toxocara canis]|uniref:Phospholipid scramblase n=1 Tax=Toxocara canis TaxID=6265 RepID=A0A183UWJ5_TOXCA|nr:unnamed protein product [Toxocara canis]
MAKLARWIEPKPMVSAHERIPLLLVPVARQPAIAIPTHIISIDAQSLQSNMRSNREDQQRIAHMVMQLRGYAMISRSELRTLGIAQHLNAEFEYGFYQLLIYPTLIVDICSRLNCGTNRNICSVAPKVGYSTGTRLSNPAWHPFRCIGLCCSVMCDSHDDLKFMLAQLISPHFDNYFKIEEQVFWASTLGDDMPICAVMSEGKDVIVLAKEELKIGQGFFLKRFLELYIGRKVNQMVGPA